jgi:hypothetical protein
MAFYFRPFPTISYRIPGQKKSIPVTDITRRFAVSDFFRKSKITFDEYVISDGERPDTVAYDYYGDQKMDWLILLTNEIQDPYFQWAMSYDQFQAYLKQKYGSLEYTLREIHHYEKIIQKQKTIVDEGINQRILPEKTLTVDYTTYLTLVATDRKAVTIFEHETNINDSNRFIYLLDLNYLQIIKEQHPYIFNEGVSSR